MAGFMDGEQNLLHQVIHFIGDAQALCKERTQQACGLSNKKV
jgi:hypothetical protein